MLNLSNCEPFLDAPYPYTELQEACIRDLETTQEERAQHKLESLNVGFCCMGRFCAVAKAERAVIDNIVSYKYKNDDAIHILPNSLADELLLEPGGRFRQIALIGAITFDSLASMNDSGFFTFKDIAQYIRHDPWNVFRGTPLPKGNA